MGRTTKKKKYTYIHFWRGGIHKYVVSNKVSKCFAKSEWGVCTRSLFKNCI